MKELRVHMDIVQAAVDAPPLVPGTREYAEAQKFYEAIYGAGAADAHRSQDSGPWVEIVRRIHSLEAQSKITQAKLEKVEWYELFKALKQSLLKHKLGKIQGEITRYKTDLDNRVEIYLKLAHEADARTAERLIAQVVGGNQLAAAARRHREAQATLDQLRRELRDGEHKEAAEAVAVALDDYGKLLLSVGENLTKVGAGAAKP
jgi:hypothetical protein